MKWWPVSSLFICSSASGTIVDGNKKIPRTIFLDGKNFDYLVEGETNQPISRLDRGNGKELTLDECSREQLEKEVCVRFYRPTYNAYSPYY